MNPVNSINELCRVAYSDMVKNGFYDGTLVNVPEKLALVHSEVSEALDAARHDYPIDEHCPQYGNFEIELADTCIRIFDLCGFLGVDLGGAIQAKMEFNKTRPPKHGKMF